MKILYAAGNRIGSFFQLKRFLQSVQHKDYSIKIAAFKKSSGDLDIDYTLDSLLNITNPREITFNGNYSYYSKEIRRFAPDLIISDFEVYTSIIALDLNIKLWQFSPNNLYYAIPYDLRYKLKIHKNYFHLLDINNRSNNFISNILNNSDRKFVLSHLADADTDTSLINNYEWARPNFILGDGINQIDYLLAIPQPTKNIIDKLKNKKSSLFFPYNMENYPDLNPLMSERIYQTYLENCKFFVSDGTASFLADAFYNQKFAISYPRYDDIEAIIGATINQYYGLGSNNIITNDTNHGKLKLNYDVKFMSEYLEEV